MTLDANDTGSWVPREGEKNDPVDSTDITNTPKEGAATGPIWDQNVIDLLRETRGYHRKAVRAINDYIAKAKANRDGTTEPTGQKFRRG
jgi:hypothetical protein